MRWAWLIGAGLGLASGMAQDPEPRSAKPSAEEPTGTRAANTPESSDPWADFPAMVWRQRYRGLALPDSLADPFGGCNVERDEPAAFARTGRLDFYVGHGPGRDVLHLDRHRYDWQRAWRPWSRDPGGPPVQRPDDPSDPKVRKELFRILGDSLAARDGDHGVGVSLGDEVSWTPWGDPVDLQLHPSAEERWMELRRREFGEPVGSHWIPRTEEVRRAWLRGNSEALGPWLARRRFEQDLLLELLGDLAETARAQCPGVGIGLLGLSGRTAFGGASVDRSLPLLDFAEAYATGDARELLMTLRRPGQRVLSTVFLEAEQPGRAAWQAWDQALRGGDGLVIWSDRLLEAHGESATSLAKAVEDIRRLRSELPGWRPRPGGLALLHSEDSVAIGFLRDALLDGPTWPHRFQGYQEEHGTRERDLRTWLRLAEDAGYQPGALPMGGPSGVDGATVDRFPVLIANHLEVLGAEELARLTEFLACGGHLLVRGRFGSFDDRGVMPENPPLEELRRAFPAAVHGAPPHFDLYLSLRDHTEDRRVAAARDVLTERMRDAGRPPPLAPKIDSPGQPPKPWLRGATWNQERTQLTIALLPSPDRARGGTGHLGSKSLEVAPPEGWSLEVLHPLGGDPTDPTPVDLGPGEAIVLRLSRP